MKPAVLPTWKQKVISLLCSIDRTLKQCCQNTSCFPVLSSDVEIRRTELTATTTPQQLVGNDPRRMSFTVSNVGGTAAVNIGLDAANTTNAKAAAAITNGSSQYFSSLQFPASITRTWYVRAQSGSQSIVVQEEYLSKRGK